MKTLKRLGYVISVAIDQDEIDLVYEEVAMDYKESIMYKFWKNWLTVVEQASSSVF